MTQKQFSISTTNCPRGIRKSFLFCLRVVNMICWLGCAGLKFLTVADFRVPVGQTLISGLTNRRSPLLVCFLTSAVDFIGVFGSPRRVFRVKMQRRSETKSERVGSSFRLATTDVCCQSKKEKIRRIGRFGSSAPSLSSSKCLLVFCLFSTFMCFGVGATSSSDYYHQPYITSADRLNGRSNAWAMMPLEK